jgi:DNA polymerase-3 subunit alpha
LPDVAEWPTSEKLKYEKEALDFYFSSHPLAQFEEELRLSSHRLDQLSNLGPNQEVMIGGMLTGIRYQNTKKARNGNSRYARCRLEDLTGSVECVMWPDDFLRSKDEFQEDRPCFVKGVVERTREQPGLVLSRVMSIEQAKKELARSARGLGLQILLTEHSPAVIDSVACVLQEARGSCPVCLDIYDGAGNKARLRAGQEFSVNPTSVDIGRLESILGKGRAKLVW